MNSLLISLFEVEEHQRQVQLNAQRARNEMTVSGIRQIVGSTFIALGTKLHGRIEQERDILAIQPHVKPARSI